MEQLDEVVEEIRKLMLGSQRKRSARGSWTERNLHEQQGRCRSRSNEAEEPKDNSRRKFGIQEDFNHAGKLMRRSS
jgi:hypothetical protein